MTGQLEDLSRRLQEWAENSPQNFQAEHLLIAAEIARLHRQNSHAIDLYEAAIASVMKAARAITAEIVLEGSLRELVRIAIENAGAQRALLLQEQDGQLVVAATGAIEGGAVNIGAPKPHISDTPRTWAVISYVRQTDDRVAVGDGLVDERFATDPYIVATRPRSILCVPIVHYGKLGGILYLENNLAPDAFRADRIELFQLLSAQAAVSLKMAKLYAEMKQEVLERQRAEERLRAVTEGTASVTGDDFFQSLVRHLALTLQVPYAFVAKCTGVRNTRVRTLAFWQGDHLGDNVEYNVAETPCLKVVDGTVC
jgi:transcriptional regulator with GAF, ATPase, and Fis domain